MDDHGSRCCKQSWLSFRGVPQTPCSGRAGVCSQSQWGECCPAKTASGTSPTSIHFSISSSMHNERLQPGYQPHHTLFFNCPPSNTLPILSIYKFETQYAPQATEWVTRCAPSLMQNLESHDMYVPALSRQVARAYRPNIDAETWRYFECEMGRVFFAIYFKPTPY